MVLLSAVSAMGYQSLLVIYYIAEKNSVRAGDKSYLKAGVPGEFNRLSRYCRSDENRLHVQGIDFTF